MRIWAKLFLWMGSLIVLLGILMFFVPKYFIQKDVSGAISHIHFLVHREQALIEKKLEEFLSAKEEDKPGNVKALVFLIHQQEKTIIEALSKLDKSLSTKISSQVFLMLTLSLIASLIILGRISMAITKPLVQLARATEDISKGNYKDLSLPEMGDRKDEIAVLTKSFKEMVEGMQERETIRGVLNKVVSKDVADEILKSSIHLGGEDRIVTMLFSDIRGFTHLTQNLPPQEIIALLNQYMTKMSRVIEGEGGVIDKYVGDEIMALYGAPTSYSDHAIRALSAAILMIETLKNWNFERKSQGEPPIEMGIGIHTGIVVAGNMGAEDRLNYTVLGSNVNLAARLCQSAKPMQIIISEHTLEEPLIKESFYCEPLESMILKGFPEPIKIYGVLGFKWIIDEE